MLAQEKRETLLANGWVEITDPFRKGAPAGGYSNSTNGTKVKKIHANKHGDVVLKDSPVTKVIAYASEEGDTDSSGAEVGGSPLRNNSDHRVQEDGDNSSFPGGRCAVSTTVSSSSGNDI